MVICECGSPVWIKKTSECRRCYNRRYSREHYTPRPQATRPPPVTPCGYSAAHYRVRSTRGAASEHMCHCGAPAREWSYRGSSPAEIVGVRQGRVLKWSPLTEDYDPMCVPCHRARDGGLFAIGNTSSNKRASRNR